MFTQKLSMKCSCGQYDMYLKDELLKIGYKEICLSKYFTSFIVNNFGGNSGQITNVKEEDTLRYNRMRIEEFNSELFLALAAMTDEPNGNYGEYWTYIKETNSSFTKGRIYKQLQPSIECMYCFMKDYGGLNGYSNQNYQYFRKSSVEEIIANFGNEIQPNGKVEININTKASFDAKELEISLKDVPKDELKVVVKNLQDIKEVVQKVIDTPVFIKGDYVRHKLSPLIYGMVADPVYSSDILVLISRPEGHVSSLNINNLEKWTPRKGELCIFWDDIKHEGGIRIFNSQSLEYDNPTPYKDSVGSTWDNCIPFINEAQFKEFIGYDSQS